MNPQPVITLLTDFGMKDGFVGVMKGVMLQTAPQAQLIDISHELPPFSISAAAFLNEWSFGYFPIGTVHLCVVDPGVGTRRRVLAMEMAGHFFVGPDNGLFTPLYGNEKARIFHANNPRFWLDRISHTFHGRDIFSPLAAHLARGVPIEEIGVQIDDPIRLDLKTLDISDDVIECSIRYIDHFGNLVTNLDQETYNEWCSRTGCKPREAIITWFGERIEGISEAYGEKKRGEFLAVFNGFDRLEISVAAGDAAMMTGLGIEDVIYVRLPGS